MTEQQKEALELAKELGFTEYELELLKKQMGLTPEDKSGPNKRLF